MSGKPYGKDIRDEIVKLHLEQKRTISSLSKEYGISASTISRWLIVNRNRSYIARENGCRLIET